MNIFIWALFFWIAPFITLFALYWKFLIWAFISLIKVIVWTGQGALSLAEKVIQKAQELWRRRQ